MDSELPEVQAQMLERVVEVFGADPRFDAILGGGSLVHGGFDRHSDLDLVLVVRPIDYAAVVEQREDMAAKLGALLSSFGGEHVGEPRLLICLFGPPLLHVDLKFVKISDLGHLVEQPKILWARNRAQMENVLEEAFVRWPEHEPQWFEDRFWVWAHYAVTKVRRGECFEALGMLAHLREHVLGPMLHRHSGRPQRGVRRLDEDPVAREALLPTVAAEGDTGAVETAIRAMIALYLQLREESPPERLVPEMPQAVEALLGD